MSLHYSDSSDLHSLMTERELYEITTEEGGDSDEYVIADALERAERIVDSKVGVKYSIPALASDGSIPQELKNAALMIGRYLLYTRRVPPDHVRVAYADTMAWLDDVSRGLAVINLMVSGEAENNDFDRVATGSTTRSGLQFSYLP